MTLLLYPRLATKSRRAIKKLRTRFGNPHEYRPRGDLLARLARETGWTVEQVYAQLMKERAEFVKDGEL